MSEQVVVAKVEDTQAGKLPPQLDQNSRAPELGMRRYTPIEEVEVLQSRRTITIIARGQVSGNGSANVLRKCTAKCAG